MSEQNTANSLHDAARRLANRGLWHDGDSLSQRVAGAGQVMLLRYGSEQPQFLAISAHTADLDPVQLQHLRIYQQRADVGAVLINRQPWTLSLRELGRPMPGVFDEQVRHLGDCVSLVDTMDMIGQGGANALVLPEQVLCLGMTLDRAVFNAELLEKCAKAFVLASATGKPVGTIPWLVRYIANRRLRKDQRYAMSEYANGRVPVFKSAY